VPALYGYAAIYSCDIGRDAINDVAITRFTKARRKCTRNYHSFIARSFQKYVRSLWRSLNDQSLTHCWAVLCLCQLMFYYIPSTTVYPTCYPHSDTSKDGFSCAAKRLVTTASLWNVLVDFPSADEASHFPPQAAARLHICLNA
jgi:hypothetical protein